MKKNIVLTGFMGSGKSVIGKLLAEKIGFTYFDVDKNIELENALSITEIFAQKGEPYFRGLEAQMIKRASTMEKLVISCGGGVVLRAENMDALESTGVVVYLRAKPETIFERIKNDTNRPLLKVADPLSKIKELLNLREQYYTRCSFSIDTDYLSPNEIVKHITDMLFEKYNFKIK
ncbi:MAG: shikimate kinase [Endomicrobiales bacterium]|nr:shikimate kinase [Endomicrobiales bacterium]